MKIAVDRPTKPQSKDHIDWLDYARLISAIAVLCFHYFYNGIRNGKVSSLEAFPDIVTGIAMFGVIGVPLFFMISGFAILSSASNTNSTGFAVARFLRLWPTFFVCMSITALVLVVWPSPLMPITLQQYILNISMMPSRIISGTPFVDGVYWTLTCEIFFYVGVFIILVAGQIHRAQIALEIWIAWQITALLFPDAGLPLIGYDGFFAGGCAFYILQKSAPTIRAAISVFVCFIIAAAQLWSYKYPGAVWMTAFAFGLFAVMTLTPFRDAKLPHAAVLGALTYPIYLLHAHIGYTLLSEFGLKSHPWLSVFSVALIVLFIAVLIEYSIERPVKKFRRSMSQPRSYSEISPSTQPIQL